MYFVEIFTDIDINISSPWLGRPAGCRVVLPPTAAVCCLAAYNCHTSPWTCLMLITVRYWLVDDLLISSKLLLQVVIFEYFQEYCF